MAEKRTVKRPIYSAETAKWLSHFHVTREEVDTHVGTPSPHHNMADI